MPKEKDEPFHSQWVAERVGDAPARSAYAVPREVSERVLAEAGADGLLVGVRGR